VISLLFVCENQHQGEHPPIRLGRNQHLESVWSQIRPHAHSMPTDFDRVIFPARIGFLLSEQRISNLPLRSSVVCILEGTILLIIIGANRAAAEWSDLAGQIARCSQ